MHVSSHLIPKLAQFQASSVVQVKLLGNNFHRAIETFLALLFPVFPFPLVPFAGGPVVFFQLEFLQLLLHHLFLLWSSLGEDNQRWKVRHGTKRVPSNSRFIQRVKWAWFRVVRKIFKSTIQHFQQKDDEIEIRASLDVSIFTSSLTNTFGTLVKTVYSHVPVCIFSHSHKPVTEQLHEKSSSSLFKSLRDHGISH